MGKRTHRWTPPRTDRPAVKREAPPFVRTPDTCSWHNCRSARVDHYLCRSHLRTVLDSVQDKADAQAAHAVARAAAIAEKIDNGLQPGPGETAHGWVYYIQIDGLIKIGYARNIANRMRSYPPTAILLAAEPGTTKVEKARHQHFGKHLAKGREWFHDTPDLREWIDTLVTEYGTADHMAHTWGREEKRPPPPRLRNRHGKAI